MKRITNRTKKFWNDHKVAIAVTATSYLWLKVVQASTMMHNDFLREHDLYNVYYHHTDES